MFALFSSGLFFGQNNFLGATIAWDQQVGCQLYAEEVIGDTKKILIENIEDGKCIKVCEKSQVNYLLTVGSSSTFTTQWIVLGGTIASQSNDSCQVIWGTAGSGSIGFIISNNSETIIKTICIDKAIIPTANFSSFPNTPRSRVIFGCRDQQIFFTNQSTNNNGSNVVSYIWDFGDNTSSTSENTSHTYTQDGTYEVTLYIYNGCNCPAKYSKTVKISSKGFDLLCPTVACENATRVYSLPPTAQIECAGNFNNWSVSGGTITNINQNNGDVTVLWNNVDSTGFGYLTFQPLFCASECVYPTTIRVPIVKSTGTIVGNATICLNQQSVYKLPQWPDTTIIWEIVGNVNNNLGTLIVGAQNNEIILNATYNGPITLRATYRNALLNCGGTATLNISIGKPMTILGNSYMCQNTSVTYTTDNNSITNWTLRNQNNQIITTLNGSATFNYNFTVPQQYQLSTSSGTNCNSSGTQIGIRVIEIPTALNANDVKINMFNSNQNFASTFKICPLTPLVYAVPILIDNTIEYQWSVTNGSIVGPNNGNEITVIFNGNLPANLTVIKKLKNLSGCNSLPTIVSIPIQNIDALIGTSTTQTIAATNVCANSYSEYQANAAGTTNLYSEGETYNWSIVPAYLGSIVLGQGTNSIKVLWNNIATNTPTNVAAITVVITKCTLTLPLSTNITVVKVPTIQITAAQQSVCSGGNINFTVSATNGFVLDSNTVVNWNLNDGAGTFTDGLSINPFLFNPNFNVNLVKNVTATITNPNGCIGTTNMAAASITILPSPPAAASLSTTINSFCLQSQIAATLTAGTSINGVTIQWYNNNVALTNQTSTQLIVTPAMGFGYYYFIATNTTSPNCSTRSNTVRIIQFCTAPTPCIITPEPTITNTSNQNCGILNLTGTATAGFINKYFNIEGPSTNLVNYTATTRAVTRVGEYDVWQVAEYQIPNSQELCKRQSYKKILVPYIADFSYTATCNNNTSFTVNFLDNSSFFTANITNQSVKFFYKLNNVATFIGPVTGTQISNLPAGSYNFKIEIQANYLNVLQPVCSKIINATFQPIPQQTIIVNPQPIRCHDTAVQFSLLGIINQTDSYLWTFESDAQSTLQETSRVFSTTGLQVVTLDITNKYGCTRRLTTTLNVGAATTVMIPQKCFNGSVIATPANATICKGDPLTLTYQPTQDMCAVNTYTWMNGLDPIVPAVNAATIQVFTPGSYWVKVESNTACKYSTPNRIAPIYKPKPTVKIIGDFNFCASAPVILSVNTDASLVNWFIDGQPLPTFTNQFDIRLNNLAFGSYLISVIVTKDGCTNTSSQQVSVWNSPAPFTVTQTIFCEGADPINPQYHVVLTANVDFGTTVSWSNGMSGETITVWDGGPYLVRATFDNCTSITQIDVPYDLGRYTWTFPSGCASVCYDRDLTNNPTIFGPNQIIESWKWLDSGNVILSGTNSIPQPLPLTTQGNYSLHLNNGVCESTTESLNYVVKECEKCPFSNIRVREINLNNERFCSFNVQVTVTSAINFQASLTSSNSNIIFVPNGTNFTAGTANYQLTLIPVGTFNGGTIICKLTGVLPNGMLCDETFELNLPACRTIANKFNDQTIDQLDTNNIATINIVPNPAEDFVKINHKDLTLNSTIELYDLTGRFLSQYKNIDMNGNWEINTSSFPAAIYIIVVKENNQIIAQQKLIIK